MKLEIGNVWAHAVEAQAEELAFLKRYLTFESPGAKYTRAYQTHRWDGTYSLWKARDKNFPAGLGPIVHKGATREGMTMTWTDRRTAPVVAFRPVPEGWLRPYQMDALQACLNPDSLLPGRGIVSMVTGGGKTEIFAALGFKVQASWLVLVDTKDLMHQAAERYTKRTGEQAGVVGDGIWDPRRFTVATMQTLLRTLDSPLTAAFLASIQGLVIDEVHTAAAEGYQGLLAKIPHAYWRLGFSGTPLNREDKKDVSTLGATGPVIYKADPEALAAAGYISRPKITFIPAPQPPQPKDATWAEVYAAGIVDSDSRNKRVVETALKAARPALVFVKEIRHGHMLKAMMARYARVDFVWGQDSSTARKAAIERLERMDVDILVVSAVFNKGVDIPGVLSLINAAGGKSAIQAIQRLGRGMRKTKDKDEFEMWDFMDTGKWLKNHSRRRAEAYEQAGYEVKVG